MLAERLMADQKEATKAKDRFRLTVIRMLRSELQNGAIAKRESLDADEELSILTREVKRRQEALGDYERSGRQDLLEDLKNEIVILRRYLPEQFTEAELGKIISEAIAESGAQSLNEMGKVMGLLMPRVKGRADGGLVRRLVEQQLQ
ncbi:MAG: GatB/YqeY domain-containing protein [Firmicutes bacterium]|nr:GatB/YqeY domain-containing protein [Bacillota bacterium]